MPILSIARGFLFVLTLGASVYGQTSNVWNGLTPLKSTRSDVEKALGKPAPPNFASHASSYKTKEGNVWILYSTGLCAVDPAHGWNVAEQTVVRISFDPDYPHPYKFSNLKINRNKFERRPDPGSLHLVSYTNDIDGIVLTVDTADDSVRSFGYFPESKFDYLKCKKEA